jgi:O-antigen/teichoic acid export membrane protein
MRDLRARAIRGGVARVVAQGISLPLRMGSLMVLARLLDPRDFGLVGMVTAVTGIFSLFKDFGLSTATVQRPTVTEEQISTLFWVNVLVGAILCLVCVIAAPVVAAFYREPRLTAVMAVLATGFVFNGAGVQHSVLLQRQMRFVVLAVIDVASLIASIAIGVFLARGGHGYWALVWMTVSFPLAVTIGCWAATAWIPGRPRGRIGLLSMMRFGGTLTLNGIVVYTAYNFEKVLLGRFWGAATVGLYGRAYQLITLPTENLNAAVGGVAFSALSRVQNDPERLKRYFLKGYTLLLTLTVPLAVASVLFADDLMVVVLGPKWVEAGAIFRLLAPMILVFALINPLGWLMFALGLVGRSLRVALVLAPLLIAAYVVALPYGPKGVAFAYSAALTLWVVPHIAWCLRGTAISLRDTWRALKPPLIASLIAGGLATLVVWSFGGALAPPLRIALGSAILFITYGVVLLSVMKQTALYVSLLNAMTGRSSLPENMHRPDSPTQPLTGDAQPSVFVRGRLG